MRKSEKEKCERGEVYMPIQRERRNMSSAAMFSVYVCVWTERRREYMPMYSMKKRRGMCMCMWLY